ncbi:putative serine protease protein [Eutypa lata UCREL1]|uniref:Putative serine protease protein n=1 Tax=Eutypa lata (strain UCR-EL1) TaxID=1287681 RepID=M7SDN3_EUTLA|nr:putative serine protease protein [Eutypa lata UCREL1]
MARTPGIDVIPAQDGVHAMFCDGRRSLEQLQNNLRRAILQDDASKPVDEYNDIVRAIQGYQLSDDDLEILRNVLETFKTKVEKVDTELLKALRTGSRNIGYQRALVSLRRPIAFIATQFANGFETHGSGAFIGPDLVLTAAHNVFLSAIYHHSSGDVQFSAACPHHIRVQRGRWGKNPNGGHEFEEHVGTLAVMNASFTVHDYSDYDFAIIKIATTVDRRAEPLSYRDYPSLTPGRELRTVGFPGDLPNQFKLDLRSRDPDDGYYPYESMGEELPVSTQDVLRHSMQTAPGNSGGPIFLHGHDEVVAVHCAGVPKPGYNEASYIGRDGNNIEAYKTILDLAAQAVGPRGLVVIDNSVN